MLQLIFIASNVMVTKKSTLFALYATDTENKTFRYLQTQPTFTHMAKDRSGVLDENEIPKYIKPYITTQHNGYIL